MKKIMISSVAALLLLSVAAVAQPGNGGICPQGFEPGTRMHQGGGPGQGMGMGQGQRGDRPGFGGLLAMADELELTPEQIERLETMRTQFQLEQVDARADLRKAEIKLKDLMRDDNTSETQVMAAIDEVAGLKADLQKKRYLHGTKAKAVLTTEQQEKAKELRAQFGQRRGWFDDDDTFGKQMRHPRGGRR